MNRQSHINRDTIDPAIDKQGANNQTSKTERIEQLHGIQRRHIGNQYGMQAICNPEASATGLPAVASPGLLQG